MLSWPALTGSWQLRRQTSHGIHASGMATITQSATELLHYHEDVMTTLANGDVLAGERRYNFRYTGAGLDIYYADGPDIGQLFQSFDLTKGEGSSKHLCKKDAYISTFKWQADGSFSLTHEVSGPAKNYVMHTLYTKA